MSSALASKAGGALARWLTRSRPLHSPSPPTAAPALLAALRPADVLLVEGNSRISVAIRYLTQSTWSHAALFVGFEAGLANPDHCFVEADLVEGVRSVGLDEFAGLHTRICRPLGLSDDDARAVIHHVVARLGHRYDLKNIVDLVRYLLPTPPVPTSWRRRMIGLGSGDPTRAICSTLIAGAFQSIRYPILPEIEATVADSPACRDCVAELWRIRHQSLFTPRDFDASPYFQIVKPGLAGGFDFHRFKWADGGVPGLGQRQERQAT
ncbi:C40 family peptidase [Rhodopila globiformis]|uniref:Lipo-like protein n=1 Tax=Rhodopila globiformis TaxID=1071 RepID=A0A2S6MVF2_RHOGL|nr:lipo-like protein [Rhodopila globiformis]PPQ26329.1 lipo-like protein [Rhodopila globiformis]